MNTLNTGNRIGTMLLDHVLMTVIIMVVVMPGVIYDIAQTFGNPNAQPKLMLGNYYLNLFAFPLYFNKDIYLGRSLGKRILKLQLIDIKTGQPANALRCFVRNLTIILWPIEGILALANNERRIGDFIAGTKLVPYNVEEHKGQPNWVFMTIALLASILFVYFTMFYPIELLTRGMERVH
ncbi:RDD family protein [Pseudochryseolinea flava]|uniref:RDD domain-containing protein n=1 Tax=Pseudochryseolinea flava TaxID=2059302 RepID=A0A364XW98_9BACT|nr:RDD family protein [Pseudochryseolinea flava]RAV97794.1 hypothetical protein DQQ10_26850 [Pseudochryseolinea flava]